VSTKGRLFRRPADQAAARLIAIRAIVESAGGGEGRDVAAASLLVLGASQDEITAATLGLTVVAPLPLCGASPFGIPPVSPCGRKARRFG
jgi:hypothetical protein